MNSTARTVNPLVAVRDTMLGTVKDSRARLTSYLPAGVTPSRFMALAERAIADNPEIWGCTEASVLRALSAAAASGLPIDGKMSSIVVRKNKRNNTKEATWDPSYRGMCYLALESGHILSVEAYAVRQNDLFEVDLGTTAKILHRPALQCDPGPVVAAYAVAHLKSGGIATEVVTLRDLEQIRAMGSDNGPWNTWPDRMAMKSAMRRLLKKLPAADVGTLSRAHQFIDEEDSGDGSQYRVSLRPIEDRPALPDELTTIEASALEAIGDAGSDVELLGIWEAILASFKQAKAEVPIAIEARYRDRLATLRGDE